MADETLIPVIVQDAETHRVLMLAYANDEAIRLTRETGEAWFWSRSRQELWHKGATSGNTLAVDEVADDCDGDAFLYRVRPNGPACHTPRRPSMMLSTVRDRTGSMAASTPTKVSVSVCAL